MLPDAFAAKRREQLEAGDERLGPIVSRALADVGQEGWSDPIVDTAGRIWLENYAAEAPDAAYRAGLDRFRRRVADALENTTETSSVDRIVRWLSTYAVNAGTVQGAYRVGVSYKVWVDMEDDKVRGSHRHADGQVVPIGSRFKVGGTTLAYPGEPNGALEEIMNCRCVAQPAARSGETMTGSTRDLGSNAHTRALVAAAGAEEPRTGALVTLLPAADDPTQAASSEDMAHLTFIWMGDLMDIEGDTLAMAEEVRRYAAQVDGPVVVPVKERGTLGSDDADVLFLEPTESLLALRDGLLASEPIKAAYEAAEQFPEWIPHVTVNYGDKQAGHDPNGVEQEDSGAGGAAGRMSHLESDAIESPTDDHSQGFAVVGVQGRSGGQQRENDPRERGRASLMRDGEVRATGTSGPDGLSGALGAARQDGDAGDVLCASNSLRSTRGEGLGGMPGVSGYEHQGVPPEEPGQDRGVQELGGRPGVYAQGAGEVRSQTRSEGAESGGGSTPKVGSKEWNELVDSITEVTFDRFGLWLGGDYTEYPMGGVVSDTITADASAADEVVVDEVVVDEVEDDEEMPAEIPVHGVLAPEGVETGDGRGFREGALSTRPLPIPLRLEIVGTHGGTTSDVVTVGRIDEAWRDDESGMWQFRGTIIMTKPYANLALEGIIDGSGIGVSIDADAMAVDMDSFSDEIMEEAGQSGKTPTTWFSEARVAGLTIVPIPAFHEAYIALGPEFVLSEDEQAALAACGCADSLHDISSWEVEDLTALTPEELAEYDALDADGQAAYMRARAPRLASAALAGRSVEAFSNPTTRDGPGWITNPVATSRIRRYWTHGEGAAKIRWGVPGDFDRCRRQLAKYVQNPEWLAGLCANMHKEAVGVWPGQEGGGRSHAITASAAPILRLVDVDTAPRPIVAAGSFPGAYPAEWFANPQFSTVTPLTIDRETGRIYGHLAQWGVCHIGISGDCVKPPHSLSGYANFLKGVVDTTAGEQPVGCLTYGIGHADQRLRAAAASAHYDQMDAVVAYVNMGEDAYGIWYSGVLAPDVPDEVVTKFRAVGAISGDWRPIGRYGLDLIAGVAVNTPGYPVSIAASAGQVTALIAAGTVFQPEPESTPESFADENTEFLAKAIAIAMDRRDAKKREGELRERALRVRQAEVRERARKKD